MCYFYYKYLGHIFRAKKLSFEPNLDLNALGCSTHP